ncbi:uncharacterized protein LOC117343693 [Pecten maximus]|uniref:uncharacterized protein LOC117343693 n=1 Tax=Pecten maximus TaxID=6579 RepID=UPI001459134A|nr:uncharacterized protein LOC117343693 [Pecten maximus]
MAQRHKLRIFLARRLGAIDREFILGIRAQVRDLSKINVTSLLQRNYFRENIRAAIGWRRNRSYIHLCHYQDQLGHFLTGQVICLYMELYSILRMGKQSCRSWNSQQILSNKHSL